MGPFVPSSEGVRWDRAAGGWVGVAAGWVGVAVEWVGAAVEWVGVAVEWVGVAAACIVSVRGWLRWPGKRSCPRSARITAPSGTAHFPSPRTTGFGY
jgi:hypothetical protein